MSGVAGSDPYHAYRIPTPSAPTPPSTGSLPPGAQARVRLDATSRAAGLPGVDTSNRSGYKFSLNKYNVGVELLISGAISGRWELSALPQGVPAFLCDPGGSRINLLILRDSYASCIIDIYLQVPQYSLSGLVANY
jgi:hypothetical protein